MTRRTASDEAPRYRRYVVRVVANRPLGPSFRRVTVRGEDLREFGAAGCDQRVKLLLPRPGRTVDDVPDGADWYARWQRLPERVRPAMRTYTVRAHRAEAGELDLDLVVHGVADGTAGPAAAWAAGARPGDTVALLGPDRPGTGRMWGREWAPPPHARRLLLAGDETAVPAVAAIVASLTPGARGVACLEVPAAADIQHWPVPGGFDVRWSCREGAAHGAALEPAVDRAARELLRAPGSGADLEDVDVDARLLWEVPEAPDSGALYAWLAGEAGVIRRLRRLLVSGYGVPRSAVAFMGYWRAGRPEGA